MTSADPAAPPPRGDSHRQATERRRWGFPADHGPALHLIIFLALTVLHIITVLPVRFPTIFYDELVYLGFARLFSGGSMPIMYQGALGHFGYSLLAAIGAAPFEGFAYQYKAILILNSVLMASCYLTLYFITSRLLPDCPRKVAVVAALIGSLYPSYLIYPTLAASENAFVPLYLATAASLIAYFSRPSVLAATGVGCLGVLTFMTHNRGLGAVLVMVLIMAVALRRRALPAVSAFVVIAIATLGSVAVLVSRTWLEGATGALFPKAAVSGADMYRFGICLGGQLFALIVGTAGLYTLGLVEFCDTLRRTRLRLYSITFLLFTHLIVLIGAAFFISTQDLSRFDHVFITRYAEATIGPFIAAGVVLLYRFNQRSATRQVYLACVGSVIYVAQYALLNTPVLANLQSLSGDHVLRLNMISLMPVIKVLRVGDAETLALYVILVMALLLGVAARKWAAAVVFVGLLFTGGAAALYKIDVLWTQAAFPVDPVTKSPAAISAQLTWLTGQGTHDIGYDVASWNAFHFSIYQLYHPTIRFVLFDSRTQEIPRLTAIFSTGDWRHQGFRKVATEIMGGPSLWVAAPSR